MLEGFAVADLCLFDSSEEPITWLTEETRLWDQELHTCGHTHTQSKQSHIQQTCKNVAEHKSEMVMHLTNWVTGVIRREGVAGAQGGFFLHAFLFLLVCLVLTLLEIFCERHRESL